MDKKQDKTLRELLDEHGVGFGDDRGFILKEGYWSGTIMSVSRRYIESAPWRYLLDRKVIAVGTEGLYGEMTLIVVEGK